MWDHSSKVRILRFETNLVKFTQLKLHFPLIALIQQLIHFVSPTIEVAVADTEITENCFEACFYSDLGVPINREECIINHPSIDSLSISFFSLLHAITIVVGYRYNEAAFVEDLFVSIHSRIKSSKNCTFCFDNQG